MTDYVVNINETVTVTGAVAASAGLSVSLSEQVGASERLTTGDFQVDNPSGSSVRITLASELHFDGATHLGHYLVDPDPEAPGAPVQILQATLGYEVKRTGSSGRVVPELVSGVPDLSTGFSRAFEFYGEFDNINDLGDFIHINNGSNGGTYQVTSVLSNTMDPNLVKVQLDRPLILSDDNNGFLTAGGVLASGDLAVELIAITNDSGSPPYDYTYRFRVNDPRVTIDNPILGVYRVVRDAREASTLGTVLNPDNGAPAAEDTVQEAYVFAVSTVTLIDYQTFEVTDPDALFIRSEDASPPAPSATSTVTSTVDRFTCAVQISGSVDWEQRSGVQEVLLQTSKLTGQARYFTQVQGLKLKDSTAFTSERVRFTAQGVPKPRLVSASVQDRVITLRYSEAMQLDDAHLNAPTDYTVTGPTAVRVLTAQSQGSQEVSLFTRGLGDGDYTLEVLTNTPKDLAGNPLDPLYNTAIFTTTAPLTERSIFTDKGPISKPPLTLQSGATAAFASFTEVTLPGAALTASHIGKTLRLSGSASNNGDYRIVAVPAATTAKVIASFTLPDVNSGAVTWALIDRRLGQIADDPSDVSVRVNGSSVTPEAVIGLQGQIVLPSQPSETDEVKVDYTWCCNPRVEVRRLNSTEFRLNGWNRDVGGVSDSGHHYRFNNVLITPSEYDPDDTAAPLEAPLLRGLKYRAYERAYTAVLNDPNLLLLNTPIHRIAYPPASRPLVEEAVFYEGLVLPENDATPWVRKGTGVASVLAGVLTVNDNVTGDFPTGQPLFWTQTLDLTFDHVFSAAWRLSLDSVATSEGVWTGVAAGYANDKTAFVLGYLDDGGVKKIGFLKREVDEAFGSLTSWTGGIDSGDSPTNAPVEFDWSILHSYRLFTDQQGVVRLFVDGEVVETLRIAPDEAPFLVELNAPFDEIQGAFFGSLSRLAESTSSWDFYRYLIQPVNSQQTSPSSFVNYEANGLPEVDPSPWTPVGFHGTASIKDADFLLLDSTSATDASTSAEAGLVEGDFLGYVKIEPLLSSASQWSVDIDVQLLTYTHGEDPDGLMLAVDDSTRLLQLSFFPDQEVPKISYGGRSLPTEFSPYVWSELGTQTAALVGRYLQVIDSSTGDGKVYYYEDVQPLASTSRVLGYSNDYIVETRFRVNSYTADGSGFAGAFVQAYDSLRLVGLMLQEVAGVKYIAFHSDGVALGVSARFAFDWDDGVFHTYRIRKSTTGDLVSLFVDGDFLGSYAYSSFSAPAPDTIGVLSFGSSTATSTQAQSDISWGYCNAWRINTDTNPLTLPRKFAGFWKGTSYGDLRDYHLPTKAVGREASVVANTLQDALADFVTAGVVAGDRLVVDVGGNAGIYVVQNVLNAQTLTLVTAWPVQPTNVAYRVVRETDWSSEHKYRVFKDPVGNVLLFLDTDPDPIIAIGYNSLDLPVSGSGVVRTLSSGLPAVAFGSFSVSNLAQSRWDFVRYGISKHSTNLLAVPPHQVLNQWNVMESPERLFTLVPHTRVGFKSSSTGTTPQYETDFLDLDAVPAYTQLNEGTPLVPQTQTFENRGPYTTQVYIAGLNNPEAVLNSPGSLALNNGAVQFKLVVPDDVLYTSLVVKEFSEGELDLLRPFDDDCGPMYGSIQYQKEVCLEYTADALPEDDTTAATTWVRNSDDEGQVSTSIFNGVLTYGTAGGGTRTVYLNNTPLPDAPSLQTEATFRLKLQNDATLGLGDSQVRFGLSAPGMTIGLGFVTTSLGDRFVLVFDLNNGTILGSSTFDYLDGNFHTYRIVRTPGKQLVEIFIDS